MYKDLRDWIETVDKMGELSRLEGVSWDLEVSAIAEMTPNAVLFDNFAGYPRGYRILANVDRPSVARWLLTVNMQTKARGNALAREWKDRLLSFQPMPPRWVNGGPVQENVQEGNDINVLKFPAPKIHPEDGGRYIGTGDVVICQDPDTGRLNIGTFRMQVHDRATLGLFLSHGKDTALIVEDYHRQGKPCPVVAVVGIEPAMIVASRLHLAHYGGISEFDFAGWLKREPVEVVKGKYTGLPIPASAEIAIEGEILPGDTMLEGPFGEWTGYSEPRQAHAIRIKRVLHRNDPIMTMTSPSGPTRPPGKRGLFGNPVEGGVIWEQMERAGVRGVQGVAVYSRFLVTVSIRNRFAGHSRQAGHIATQCQASAFMGKYVIVVDDDIDPYNIQDVLWAVIRRADPERAIDIMRYCWSDRMDSVIISDEKCANTPAAPVYNSRCVIDACRPIEWGTDLKRPVEYDQKLMDAVREKWGQAVPLTRGLGGDLMRY